MLVALRALLDDTGAVVASLCDDHVEALPAGQLPAENPGRAALTGAARAQAAMELLLGEWPLIMESPGDFRQCL